MPASNIENTVFDYRKPATFPAALQTDGLFLLGPPVDMSLFELLAPFVDYLEQNQYAGRVVYLSVYGVDALPELPFHQQMEAKLRQSQLRWNVVRPGFFMDNFGNYERESIEQRNQLFAPAADGATPFVSARDVGRSVAALLTGNFIPGGVYTLTGGAAYRYGEVANMLSEILQRPIAYPAPDTDTYRNTLLAAGAPGVVADYMNAVYGLIRDGIVREPADGVERITGRAPESLRTVLVRDFGGAD